MDILHQIRLFDGTLDHEQTSGAAGASSCQDHSWSTAYNGTDESDEYPHSNTPIHQHSVHSDVTMMFCLRNFVFVLMELTETVINTNQFTNYE